MILSGCSDKCGDPREDGFLSGLSGVYGGCYDKRLAEKNNQLDAEKRRAEELKLQAVMLNAQYEKVKHEIDLHAERVAQVPTRTPQQKKEAKKIISKLGALRTKSTSGKGFIPINPVGSPADQENIGRAEQEYNQLERECKEAFEEAKAFEKAIETENKTID